MSKPEVVAYVTHHDEPMLFTNRKEAAAYCDDGEEPIALIYLTDHEADRAVDKARIAELEQKNAGLLGLYREAEEGWKQCVIDREAFSDELTACTESPGGCGYWREAARHRAGERDHALALLSELINDIRQFQKDAQYEPYVATDGLMGRIDAALAQQGKEGEK